MAKIVSYNCNSIRNNIETVRSLLSSADIVVLQELMLCMDDLPLLNDIDVNFDNTAMVEDRDLEGISEGRPSRGVAIFWRKKLSHCVKPVLISDSVIGVILSGEVGEVLLINTYMPCDLQTLDALDKYRQMLATLETVIREQNINNVIVIGDFNADPRKGRFWKELPDFVGSLSLTVVDDQLLPVDSFTYLCPAKSTTSWLDHVMCSKHIKGWFSDMYIDYDMALYDHFPLCFNLSFNFCFKERKIGNAIIKKMVDWNKVTGDRREKVKSKINDIICNNETLYCEIFSCKKENCSDKLHLKFIDETFEDMKCLLLEATNEFSFKINKGYRIIPGWNDCVKDSHKIARMHFLQWKAGGRPCEGELVDKMKISRSHFQRSLKNCKVNEEQIRKNKLLDSLKNKNYKEFWKEVDKVKKHNVNEATVVDGEMNPLKICNIFSDKYRKILARYDNSCSKDTSNSCTNQSTFCNVGGIFNKRDIEYGIAQLKPGIGFDGIHSNHLKLLNSELLTELVSGLFSAFVTHSYTPEKLTDGTINPTIKDKFGDLSCSENYRPVMVSSVFLKLFEYCLLRKISPFIRLNDRQHGFRATYSTNTACLTLKETVLDYMKAKSEVFSCFIDIKKAFDSIDHQILMIKLLKCGIPQIYVNVVKYWYTNQYVNVRFMSSMSDKWKIENGVRQGGVLSGLFFCIYMDSLIDTVASLKYGCKLGIHDSSIIVYADDIVLLAPSLTSLQFLIDKASKEARELKLNFNDKKSKFMLFCNNKNNKDNTAITDVKIDGKKIENVTSFKYLGYMITNTLSNSDDIARARNKFYRDFNFLLRSFHFADTNVKLFLFKQYCLQLYGCELWFCNGRSLSDLRQFAIGYHKAIKKILGISYHESNHYSCQEAKLLIFKHFLNSSKINAAIRIFSRPCEFIKKVSSFLLFSSVFLTEIRDILFDVYDIDLLFENDRDAIMARIMYVQNHEKQLREGWDV